MWRPLPADKRSLCTAQSCSKHRHVHAQRRPTHHLRAAWVAPAAAPPAHTRRGCAALCLILHRVLPHNAGAGGVGGDAARCGAAIVGHHRGRQHRKIGIHNDGASSQAAAGQGKPQPCVAARGVPHNRRHGRRGCGGTHRRGWARGAHQAGPAHRRALQHKVAAIGGRGAGVQVQEPEGAGRQWNRCDVAAVDAGHAAAAVGSA